LTAEDRRREQPLAAEAVLRRAGIKLEQVLQGNFSDEQFAALADALRTVKMSKLVTETTAR